MASLGAFLPLAVCLLMGGHTLAKNDAPCQHSTWNNAYNTFLYRHVRSDTPSSLDQNEWERYIKKNNGCDRPTQSFLQPSDLDRVKAVCSSQGGAVFKLNLCISRQMFTFVTVRIHEGTCGIRSVQRETKHLILACDELNNQCLPVHFEGNPYNKKPNNNARGCEALLTGDDAPSFKMTWLWLLSALLVIVYCYRH